MTRTTLAIDPEVLAAAKQLADARGISLGESVSFLIRQGLSAPARFRRSEVSGFLMFDVPEAPKFTSEDVERELESDDLEYAKFFRKPA